MKTAASILAGAGLALAAPSQFLVFKRTPYDLCDTDCNLAGLAYPDKHTLQLALENNWSEQCPQVYFGDANAPTATSRVCLEISGTNVLFSFESFPGYTYSAASVAWKVAGNADNSAGWAAPPPTDTLDCVPNPSTTGFQCTLPFSAITGPLASSSIKDLLAGMCPNGDREGLGLYFEFSGVVTSATETPASALVVNSSPCTARDSSGACTARNNDIPYIAMVYRCSKCNIAPCPVTTPPVESSTTSTSTSTSSTSTAPVVTTKCNIGTAFGYAGAGKATTLNTQSGQGCNRWGWYSTPTLAELQAGVSGTLLVGAGGNDVSKATNVGTYSAQANAAGKVTFTYNLVAPYTLSSDAHVDFDCLPIDKCAPGQYTINIAGLNGASTYTTYAVNFPTCPAGSKPYLIVHAAVGATVTGTTCPAPVS